MHIIKTPLTLGEESKRVFQSNCQNIYQRLFGWVNPYFIRVLRWGVLQHFVELFRYFTQEVLVKKNVKPTGPNSLEELLLQFDLPKKEKTKEDIIRDYQVFLTMAAIEIDLLKMGPPIKFYSHNWVEYEGGKAYYDWVPCIVRPEIIYCCYGKN